MDVTLKRASEANPSPNPKRSRTETILINPLLEEEVFPNLSRRALLSSSSHLTQTWHITDTLTMTSPGSVSFTRCGRVPHLTPDISSTLSGNTVLFSLQSVISNPGKAVLTKYGKSFKSYINEPGKVVIISSYDVSECANNTHFTDQNSISVWGKAGRQKLTVKNYMELVNVFTPDIFICMADNVPAGGTMKRADKACSRTLNWLNESLTYMKDSPCKVVAVVPGSGHRKLMMKAASILATREVWGYVIERVTLPKADWCELVRDVISVLPEGKPVFMLGCLNSAEVVTAYSAGCHFVDTSCCLAYSDAGLALSFDIQCPDRVVETTNGECEDSKENTENFGPSFKMSPKAKYKKNMGEEEGKPVEKKGNGKKKDSGKVPTFSLEDYVPPNTNGSTYIDLKDTKFCRTFESLQEGCACFTCSRHTKAYVNHLLVTKELLGPTLLMIHNLYHSNCVLEEVRRRVEEGRLEEYRSQCGEAFRRD